jgi:hypothetical protein
MNLSLSSFVAFVSDWKQLPSVFAAPTCTDRSGAYDAARPHNRGYWLRWSLGILGGSLLLPGVSAQPGMAAERIYVSYGSIERSISVNTLETYARTGTINDDLAAYAQYADPKQLQDLRKALLTSIHLSPTAISQFLYTPQGALLLSRISPLSQICADREDLSGRRPRLP